MVEGAMSCVQIQHPQLDWELPSSVPQGWIEEDPAGLAVLGITLPGTQRCKQRWELTAVLGSSPRRGGVPR